MGKISDVLEKSGVELGDKGTERKVQQQVKKNVILEPSPQQVEDIIIENPPRKVVRPHTLSSAGAWDERLTNVMHSSTGVAESIRILRSRILHPQDGRERPQTIMITSSAPQEGKSFVSANLAVTMARGLDQYSLLVDCDLRRPSQAKLFGLSSVCKRGLSDYLKEDCDLSEFIYKTSVEKLSILASGAPPVNPAELLSSERMARLVDELSGRYSDRFIIFDSPPYHIASEAGVLAKEVDGVVLVVGYGKSDRSQVKSMVELIGAEKIIGVVFNGMKSSYIQKKVFASYDSYGGYYGADEVNG
jgi:protein-tyrosine kinase